ncbi:N-acetyltransferase [Staphylococcus succinus]|uniref:GNAT family N-acetyltransferase n=1 Tax=Staphylococcus succinus TaxID=61015 RepID=UPI000E692918|nr:GNAT family N-acetyltransferase [Staphylococcus succinus]RIN30911.1 N-acetyltransferase [Staphylococcus succinus]
MIEKIDSIKEAPFSLLLLADPSKEFILEHLRKGECFVFKENMEIIGCYVLREVSTESVEIVNIVVAESKQNLGIGKKLLANACDYAKEKGYIEICVGTGNSSVQPLLFYQKSGFRIKSIDFGFFERNYEDPIYEHGILCRDMICLSKRL